MPRLPLADRIRLALFLWRLSHRLVDLPGRRRREIRRERRDNTRAAAAEVGMRRALANLGHPAALAAEYASAEGRRRPRYRRGILYAVIAGYAYFILSMFVVGAGGNFWSELEARTGLTASPTEDVDANQVITQDVMGVVVKSTVSGSSTVKDWADPAPGDTVLMQEEIEPVGIRWWVALIPVGVLLLTARIWRLLPSMRSSQRRQVRY
jgi:hypothetical protein